MVPVFFFFDHLIFSCISSTILHHYLFISLFFYFIILIFFFLSDHTPETIAVSLHLSQCILKRLHWPFPLLNLSCLPPSLSRAVCCGQLLKAAAADQTETGELIKPYLESRQPGVAHFQPGQRGRVQSVRLRGAYVSQKASLVIGKR